MANSWIAWIMWIATPTKVGSQWRKVCSQDSLVIHALIVIASERKRAWQSTIRTAIKRFFNDLGIATIPRFRAESRNDGICASGFLWIATNLTSQNKQSAVSLVNSRNDGNQPAFLNASRRGLQDLGFSPKSCNERICAIKERDKK